MTRCATIPMLYACAVCCPSLPLQRRGEHRVCFLSPQMLPENELLCCDGHFSLRGTGLEKYFWKNCVEVNHMTTGTSRSVFYCLEHWDFTIAVVIMWTASTCFFLCVTIMSLMKSKSLRSLAGSYNLTASNSLQEGGWGRGNECGWSRDQTSRPIFVALKCMW